jgi:universal stress protein A
MKNVTEKTKSPSETIELVPFYLKIKKILVPIDFSKASQKALRYAIPFAAQFEASITLVHVMDHPVEPSFMPLAFDLERVRLLQTVREKAQKKLKELYPSLVGASGIKVRTIVLEGKAYQEIVNTAEKLHSDLIIMATHGFTGLKHAVLGSTTERVVRHATCPVLTVRDRK